jgi:uncharacterized protein (TIGR02001 family)
MKKILLSAVVATVVMAQDITTSANISLTSNYVWRGMTQTDNAPAIQGGFDFGYKGFYIGTWASNISWTNENDSSMELDGYFGYANKYAGIDYDLGYIRYAYPKVQKDYNFDEVYLSLGKEFSFGNISVKYSKAVDVPSGAKKLDDIEGTYSTILPQNIGLSLTYGDYEDTGKRTLVTLSKTVGKFDLSIAYSDFSSDSKSGLKDEDHIIATISTSF